jgi:hypothetical protein
MYYHALRSVIVGVVSFGLSLKDEDTGVEERPCCQQ